MLVNEPTLLQGTLAPRKEEGKDGALHREAAAAETQLQCCAAAMVKSGVEWVTQEADGGQIFSVIHSPGFKWTTISETEGWL